MNMLKCAILITSISVAGAVLSIATNETDDVIWDSQASTAFLRNPSNGTVISSNTPNYKNVEFTDYVASGDIKIKTVGSEQVIEIGHGTYELTAQLRGYMASADTDFQAIQYQWRASTDLVTPTFVPVVDSCVGATSSGGSDRQGVPTGRAPVAAGIITGPALLQLHAYVNGQDGNDAGSGVTVYSDIAGGDTSWARVTKVEHWGTKTNQAACFRLQEEQDGTSFSTATEIDLMKCPVNSPDYDAYVVASSGTDAHDIEFQCDGFYLVTYNFGFTANTSTPARVNVRAFRDGVIAEGWSSVSAQTFGIEEELVTNSASFMIKADAHEVLSFMAASLDATGSSPSMTFDLATVTVTFLGAKPTPAP